MTHFFPRSIFVLVVMLILSGAVPLVAQDQAAVEDSVQSAPADTIPPELVKAGEYMTQLESALDSVLTFLARMDGQEQEEREVLGAQGRRYIDTIWDIQPDLLELLPKLDSTGEAAEDIKKRFGKFLVSQAEFRDRFLSWWAREIEDLRNQRASAPPEEKGDIENRIGEARSRLDETLSAQADLFTIADSLGLDTGRAWEDLEQTLKTRAENLVGRLQIAGKTRDKLEKKLEIVERARTPDSEIGAERERLQYAKRRVEGVAKSLEKTCDMLDKRGFETTEYRQFIIKTTGEITEKILNPKILFGLVRDLLKDIWEWLEDNAPAVLVKLLILVTFVVLFRFGFRLAWWMMRLVGMSNLSRLMRDLVDRLLNSFATIIGLFSGLWFLGVNPTTLLAGIGVAGVIIGLALQESLSNLAAGFFILVSRPFDVDDVICSGDVLGKVKTMGLANTTVVSFDNRRLLIPNRKIWGEVIENRSSESVRRVDITVRIGYSEDIDRTIEILKDLLAGNERVLKKPEPAIFVSELDDSWIEIAVRPWVRNENWWPLLTELPRLVRLRFAEEGIDIPIPRSEITARMSRKDES